MPPTPSPKVPICPDCGGLLQPTDPEPLTSAEIATSDEREPRTRVCQCLICGYSESRPVAVAHS